MADIRLKTTDGRIITYEIEPKILRHIKIEGSAIIVVVTVLVVGIIIHIV